MRKELVFMVPDGCAMTLQQALRGPMGLTCRQVRSAKFRENGIVVNGVRSRVSRMLQDGDEVRVLLEDIYDPSQVHGVCFPGGSELLNGAVLPPLPEEQILFEDEDLMVADKPAGICVHPSHGHYGDTLADQVFSRYSLQGITEIPRVVGRLDKDTSGAVLFARNKVAAQRLTARNAVFKEYLALVQGQPADTEDDAWQTISADAADDAWQTISCPIARDPDILGRMIPDPDGRYGGKPAVTHLQVLFRDPARNMSLLRLRLDTGRTHQIRVHLAYIGHPLLGDPFYGTDPSPYFGETLIKAFPRAKIAAQSAFHCDFQRILPEASKERLINQSFLRRAALHCHEMRIRHPFSGEAIRVTAPLPEDFHAVISPFIIGIS